MSFFMLCQLIPYLVVWYFNVLHLRQSLQASQMPSMEASSPSSPHGSSSSGRGKEATMDREEEAAVVDDDKRRPRAADIGGDSKDAGETILSDQHANKTPSENHLIKFTRLILIVLPVKTSRKRVDGENREELAPEYQHQLRINGLIGYGGHNHSACFIDVVDLNVGFQNFSVCILLSNAFAMFLILMSPFIGFTI